MSACLPRSDRIVFCLLMGIAIPMNNRHVRADDPPVVVDGATNADSISILDAQRDGSLGVIATGHGPSQVKFTLTNKSQRRLKIVIPPGLVAAGAAGQRGGFQSMGLGGLSDQPGRFGQYPAHASSAANGFRSIPQSSSDDPQVLGIPVGQTIVLAMPSVCLSFGEPTPTPSHRFTLMDVSEYTSDSRAVMALRSLALLGTSQGVAQSVAWHVFNGMSFERIAKEGAEYVNPAEVTVAARFVATLDATETTSIVDAASLRQGRVILRIQGENSAGKLAQRLHEQSEMQSLFGLPVSVIDQLDESVSQPGSLFIDMIVLMERARADKASLRVVLSYNSAIGGWTRLRSIEVTLPVASSQLDAATLFAELDRALAASLVSATPARRIPGSTTIRLVNRLPFTVQNVVIRTNSDENAPQVPLMGLGIGPGRSATATVPAAAGFVERVELNGL